MKQVTLRHEIEGCLRTRAPFTARTSRAAIEERECSRCGKSHWYVVYSYDTWVYRECQVCLGSERDTRYYSTTTTTLQNLVRRGLPDKPFLALLEGLNQAEPRYAVGETVFLKNERSPLEVRAVYVRGGDIWYWLRRPDLTLLAGGLFPAHEGQISSTVKNEVAKNFSPGERR